MNSALLATLLFFATLASAQDLPSAAPEKWKQKAAELQNLSQGDFLSAIRKLPRPPHADGEHSGVGGAIYRQSWSGVAIQVDEDWWIVREAAAPTNVSPPPAGIPIKTHVIGFADLKTKVDADLYEALRIIHRSPSATGLVFDPVNLIRAVNHLQAMGQASAVRAMKAYVSLCEANQGLVWHQLDPDRIILLARLLWIAPPGTPIREPMLGGPTVDVKRGSPSEALFPLFLQDDLPFKINDLYSLAGEAEHPVEYLKFCMSAGQFRTKPLKPSTNPAQAAAQVFKMVKRDLGTQPTGVPPQVQLDTVSTLVWTQALKCDGVQVSVYATGGQLEAEAKKEKARVWDAMKQDFVPE